MAESIKVALASFGRGMVTFISPWNQPYEPPKWEPGLGKYFARVGGYMWKAVDDYKAAHPEITDIPEYAN